MNWFVWEPVSADSVLQAGLPYLEVFCALVGVIAVLMLVITLLHTILGIRSSNSHLEWHRFGEAKPRVDRVPSAPTPRRKLLQVAHLRGWLFTR
jgi:hypothetical protein